jgi:charged multivesicular body protein 6
LKRRKHQENLLETNQKLLDNVEEMIPTIEMAQVQSKVMASLRQGAKTLKEIQQLIDIGELEQIMDDTAEGIQKQKVISIIFSSIFNANLIFD